VCLTCDPRLELRAGPYSASVAPAAGGRVTSLAWHGAGSPRPLLVECAAATFEQHAWPKAGAFPMLPFANRLPAEGFRFRGRVVRLACGPAGYPVHGLAHRRPWQVVERAVHRVVMRCSHDGADEGWPWAWSATQEVELDVKGMRVTLRVCNDAQDAMPVGLGWHPYHPVATDVDPADLQFTAGSGHDLDHEGRATNEARPPIFTMERGRTAAFAGWTGMGRVLHPGHGAIHVTCEGAPHLVLHHPTQGDYLCVEPVSLLPGRLDAAVLAPGEAQQLTWSCGFEPVDAKERT